MKSISENQYWTARVNRLQASCIKFNPKNKFFVPQDEKAEAFQWPDAGTHLADTHLADKYP